MNSPLISYRDLLRSELVGRCRRNPNYSVRAFARDLGVSPGFISLVLNAKKGINEQRALRIADVLAWDEDKQKLFTTLVRYDNTKEPKAKNKILRELNDGAVANITFHEMSIDTFMMIADWYHYGIIELAKTAGFESDPRWIAKKLGIPAVEIREAITRLIRTGYLRGDECGALWPTTPNYTTGDVPSEAIRSFHKEMLTKAAEAVDGQHVNDRDFSGMTVAIDPGLIPEAKERIRRFRREMMAFLEQGNPTSVYQLEIGLFRLDKEVDK